MESKQGNAWIFELTVLRNSGDETQWLQKSWLALSKYPSSLIKDSFILIPPLEISLDCWMVWPLHKLRHSHSFYSPLHHFPTGRKLDDLQFYFSHGYFRCCTLWVLIFSAHWGRDPLPCFWSRLLKEFCKFCFLTHQSCWKEVQSLFFRCVLFPLSHYF